MERRENLEGEIIAGRLQLLRLLGRGGYSQVYEAKDQRLGRTVAIKIGSRRLDKRQIERFLQEARTLAALQHPHIIVIHEYETYRRKPYLVVEYALYGSLRDYQTLSNFPHKKIPLPIVLLIAKQIAEAIQYAHNNKITHRDIKPDNILIFSSQNIKLADFNIALSKSEEPHGDNHTTGTPPYKSPEHWDGQPQFASDQYSLAVMLFECLAGELPFRGRVAELHIQHKFEEPPSLHDLNPDIPVEVSEVIKKAMNKKPEDRYPSIDKFLEELIIAAQSAGVTASTELPYLVAPIYPPRHLSRRFFWELVSSILVLYTVLSSAIVTFIAEILWFQPSPTSNPPPVPIPEAGTTISTLHSTQTRQEGKAAIWLSGHYNQHIASISHDKHTSTDSIDIWKLSTGPSITERTAVYKFSEGEMYQSSLSWSPSNATLYAVSQKRKMWVWQAGKNQEQNLIAIPANYIDTTDITALAVSPNGSHISAAIDNKVYILDAPLHVQQGEEDNYDQHADYVNDLQWSPESNYTATASDDGTTHIIYRLSNSPIKTIELKDKTQAIDTKVLKVAWAPQGTHLITASNDRTLRIWDVKNKQVVEHLPFDQDIAAIAWSPTGKHIAVAYDRFVQILHWDGDAAKTTPHFPYADHSNTVNTVAFSANGTLALSASDDLTVKVWRVVAENANGK